MNRRTIEPFLSAALYYAARGWRVIPIKPRGKAPTLKGWQNKASADPTVIERWWMETPTANVGIVFGRESGIADVEFDDETGRELAERVFANVRTPSYTSGRRSIHRLFQWSEELPKQAVVNVRGLEIRIGANAKGAQSVAPPSVHPSGSKYQWLPGLSPDEVETQPIPHEILGFLEMEKWNNGRRGVDDEGIARSALSALSPIRVDDYNDWITVGMALHAASPTLLEVWDHWSRQSAKYKAGECEQKWASFKGNGVGIGTLIHLAQQDGWNGPTNGRGNNGVALSAEAAKTQLRKAPGILLSTIQSRPVSWLWYARIPLGKLTILDGDPGLGKSAMTLDIAARVSRGWPMPDGEPGEDRKPAGVVLLNAEDGLEDTIVPRLDAARADRSRITVLNDVFVVDHTEPPSLPRDITYLRGAIRDIHARLVVIDPLMAYLGGDTNAHRDQDIRRALHPLAALADETGAAILVVRHLNKGSVGGNPLYRGGGSIGIIGAARSGMLVARDPDNKDRRVLASTKCNLAKLPASLAFTLDISEYGLRIGWVGESDHNAESLLAVSRDDETPSALSDAKEVLSVILADGPKPSKKVIAEARDAGVSEPTLRRAKAVIGVKAKRNGFGSDGGWKWELPTKDDQDCQR